jgi:hypothetical protein
MYTVGSQTAEVKECDVDGRRSGATAHRQSSTDIERIQDLFGSGQNVRRDVKVIGVTFVEERRESEIGAQRRSRVSGRVVPLDGDYSESHRSWERAWAGPDGLRQGRQTAAQEKRS